MHTCAITGEPATHTYRNASGDWTYINLFKCIERGHGDARKIAFIRLTLREL